MRNILKTFGDNLVLFVLAFGKAMLVLLGFSSIVLATYGLLLLSADFPGVGLILFLMIALTGVFFFDSWKDK